jgi:hypothetical protein
MHFPGVDKGHDILELIFEFLGPRERDSIANTAMADVLEDSDKVQVRPRVANPFKDIYLFLVDNFPAVH